MVSVSLKESKSLRNKGEKKYNQTLTREARVLQFLGANETFLKKRRIFIKMIKVLIIFWKQFYILINYFFYFFNLYISQFMYSGRVGKY